MEHLEHRPTHRSRLRFSRVRFVASIALAALAACAGAQAQTGLAQGFSQPLGSVYTLSNAPGDNQVVSFYRASDGSLTPGRRYSTGGSGTGTGLGNQGALALSDSGNWLLAVNPGSNDISVFLVSGGGLQLMDTEDSGGMTPVSVTIKRKFVYVLNAGSDNIQGFRLELDGHLSPIKGSLRPLSGTGTGPAEVHFNRAGDLLVVTEKATSRIVSFPIDGDGFAGAKSVQDSPAPTPFGFAFGRRDELIVSEAAGGAAGASSLSSYQLAGDGTIGIITQSSPSQQTAACWVATTRDGRFAYTSNTGSDNVSSYGVSATGELGLLHAIAGDTQSGGAPTDVAVDRNSRNLYVLNPNTRSITVFSIATDGSLKFIENQPIHLTGSIVAAATGLVAY
jgi:6-phosphogluconolactonase